MPSWNVQDGWMGRTLAGTYLLEERLGKGGMGAVYRARHLRTGGMRAIKVLLPEAAANPEIYRRFEDEAKITSALRHPHIVQVTDFDTDAALPFIAMEYLEGITLEARIRQAPLTLEEGTEILRQVGSALQAAHDAGVVHRELQAPSVSGHEYVRARTNARIARRFSEDGLAV